MNSIVSLGLGALLVLKTGAVGSMEHDPMKRAQKDPLHKTHSPGGHERQKPHEPAPAKGILQPAEGASVKILSPKPGQLFKGDEIPLEFKLVKGKKGEHVHAYIGGEMVGMFKSEKGTLTGIKPGKHVLELRAATGDHQTELDATDRVDFMVK